MAATWNFFGMKIIVPTQNNRILKSRKNIQLHCAHTLIAITRKSTSKIIFSYIFLRYQLETCKLCSRHQNKTYSMIEPIFYSGLRSENIEF